MAIIKIGAPLTGIRGTVGGLTFSANGSGPYVKQWSKGPFLQSDWQTPVRSVVGSLTEEWGDLTQNQRDDWDTWAAQPAQARTNSLGEEYFLSGYGQFIACNTRMLTMDHALQVTAPVGAYPAAPTITVWTFLLSAGVPLVNINYNVGTFPAGTAVVFFARYVPHGVWKVAHSGWLRIAALYDPHPTVSFFYAGFWDQRLPKPAVGDQLFWRIYKQSAESLRSPVVTHTSIFFDAGDGFDEETGEYNPPE